MADKYINPSGAARFLANILSMMTTALAGKQDTLVSGTSIKTVNNQSLLGSGNITIEGDSAPIITYGESTWSEVYAVLSQRPCIILYGSKCFFLQDAEAMDDYLLLSAYGEESLEFRVYEDNHWAHYEEPFDTSGMELVSNPTNGHVLTTNANGQAVDSGTAIADLTTEADVTALILDELAQFDHLDYTIVQQLPATGEAGVRYLVKHPTDDAYEEYIYVDGQWYDIGATDTIDLSGYYTKTEADALLADKVDTDAQATSSTLGLIKLNPSESVDVNASGQLTVGGRLGQFANGGLYYPTSADPVAVGNYTLLMSEAKGLSTAHREFVIAGGSNVTCKSAAAGSTQYRVSNTQTNRFICSCFKGGRLALSEAEAKTKTVAITSVKYANGNDCVPYFGATESSNDIIITVDETLNPSSAITSIRGYGTWTNADIMSAGQGNRVEGGKHVQVGQGNHAVGNQMAQIGIRQFSKGNSSIQVGADNINVKMYSAMFGQGIDNTGGIEGGAYFGKWPIVSADTAFVVGNGTAYDARSNLFEIKTNGDIYVNGVRVL